jgi:hypothetical protein
VSNRVCLMIETDGHCPWCGSDKTEDVAYNEFCQKVDDVLYALNRAIDVVPDGYDMTNEMLVAMRNQVWGLIRALDPGRRD